MSHSATYRRMLTRMGYYSYQNGLIFRHLNQEGAWDKHIEKCRDFVLTSIDLYKPERVTVLGSGWLLELPLAEMIEKIEKIFLIDIVHPPDVVDQAGKIKNVELIEMDITGGLIEEVWNKTGRFPVLRKIDTLKDIKIPEFSLAQDPGMVISLNILTQLESLLVDYLKKRSRFPDEEILQFRALIQQKHIDFLKKFKSVLISDISEEIVTKAGEVTYIKTLISDLPESHFKQEWTWDFDLRGADLYNSKSTMKVVAMTIE